MTMKSGKDFIEAVVESVEAGDGDLPELSDVQVATFQRWWERSMMGMSAEQIARMERKQGRTKTRAAEVAAGLKRYALYTADAFGRKERLHRHLAFVRHVKMVMMHRVNKALKDDAQNKGAGLKSIKRVQKVDPNAASKGGVGAVLEETLTETHTRLDTVLIPLVKELRELDKYEASLSGLMSGYAGIEEPREIEIDIDQFLLGTYQDAGDAPQDKVIDVERVMRDRGLTVGSGAVHRRRDDDEEEPDGPVSEDDDGA